VTARRENLAAAALLAASFVLFCLYGAVTPLFEASDELWHYPFVQHLANGGDLPVQQPGQTDTDAPWRQEGSQPPLYYALAALATAPVDDSNWRELRRLNPHADLGVHAPDGNANAVLHSPAEQFPWTRAALAVRLARLVSILLSTGTVWGAWLIGRELFPSHNQSALRLGILAFSAAIPMFAFISGSVNNDNAAVLFSTLGVWWALRVARRGDLSVRAAAIAGLIAALGALSKTSALGLLGLFGLAAGLAAARRASGATDATDAAASNAPPFSAPHEDARLVWQAVRFLAVLLFIFALLAGWWFARNQALYHDLLGWNAFLDSVGRRVPPASLAQLATESEGFIRTFWGVFGTLNVVYPDWVYEALNVVALTALAGLAWAAIRAAQRAAWQVAAKRGLLPAGRLSHEREERPRAPLLMNTLAQPAGAPQQTAARRALGAAARHASVLLCLAWVAAVFAGLLRWTSLTPASQGRLMFPCLAVFAAGLSYGLWRLNRSLLWIGIAVVAAAAVAAPLAVIAPAYARPPALASPQPSEALGATFGGGLGLLGYDAPPSPAAPGDQVTLRLYWRLRQPLDRNVSVFVHLVDEHDVIVAQRDMHPGQGSIATREAEPGYAWSDRYTLRIPRAALAPARLRWVAGVYDAATGERLPAAPGGDETARFGALELSARAVATPPLLDYRDGIALESYDVQPRALAAGAPVTVTLVWRATAPVGRDTTVSLQLLDDQSAKIAQNDSAPAGGGAPTSAWQPGQVITDAHVLQIDPAAGPGVYRLLLVLYSPADFARRGAYGANGQYAGDQVELARLRLR
jgi:hypothetical protein